MGKQLEKMKIKDVMGNRRWKIGKQLEKMNIKDVIF